MTGKPGDKYWQNKATYQINLKINPPSRKVEGHEWISYVNHSPDTLKKLNFKLILNNHRATSPRLSQVSENYLTEGIMVDQFLENGENATWENENDGTNKWIVLKKPILPNDSVQLTIDWHFDLSLQSGREGVIDSTSYFLAYFYPRVAVYDDYSGWDDMNHVLSQEFYSDFNDYTLRVSVPKNYIVWATGILENPSEVLQDKYLDKLIASYQSDSIISIANSTEVQAGKVTLQNENNTWIWKSKHICDVALALSNHYNWDATSALVDSNSMRRSSVQAAYDDASTGFLKMTSYAKNAIEWFSLVFPAVPYPFPKMTVFRGFADMEYPMMANDNNREDTNFVRFVAEHEIAHSWFPFYMGINETRYGFMDEAWATTFEYFIGNFDLGHENASKNYQNFRVKSWARNLYVGQDIPIIVPTNLMNGRAMGNNEYGKASLAYLAMFDLLGDEKFMECLHGYMNDWNGKHPMPWDFFFSFNTYAKENLNWFWNAWFFSFNHIDIAVSSVAQKRNKLLITLKNKGGMPAPFDIVLQLKDGEELRFHQTPTVWKDNLEETQISIDASQIVTNVRIEGGIWMDADTGNNTWSAK
jgi:hypothetical protein